MKPENLPIFKKGQEIYDVVKEISDLIPEENGMLQEIKMQMLSDAAMLTVKVAGAEGGDLYDIRMQNAALIRKSALDLMVKNHSLKAFGFEHVEYFSIVRDLIEEYRLLFIEWVEGLTDGIIISANLCNLWTMYFLEWSHLMKETESVCTSLTKYPGQTVHCLPT